MSRYEVARLDEIEEVSDGRCPFRPVRHHFGIASFGVNAWTAKEADDRIINEHTEEGEQEELYFVQAGHARFQIDGDDVDAPTGAFVFVPPGLKRTAFAEEAGTTLLALGGERGKVYEASGFEVWAPLNALYAEGKYEEVIDRARGLAEVHPEYPMLLYNLACCEALAGRTDAAIEHLRRAVDRGEEARSLAAQDADFDSIRDEPAFKELIG